MRDCKLFVCAQRPEARARGNLAGLDVSEGLIVLVRSSCDDADQGGATQLGGDKRGDGGDGKEGKAEGGELLRSDLVRSSHGQDVPRDLARGHQRQAYGRTKRQ